MVWVLRLRLRVKEIAKSKGLSMARLSRVADINLKTLRAMYHDPYRDVAYSTLYKLASILEVPITDLVEDVSNKTDEAEDMR